MSVRNTPSLPLSSTPPSLSTPTPTKMPPESTLARIGLVPRPISTEDRVIKANNPEANAHFVDNVIITLVLPTPFLALLPLLGLPLFFFWDCPPLLFPGFFHPLSLLNLLPLGGSSGKISTASF